MKIKMATEDLFIKHFRASISYNEKTEIFSSRHEANTSVRTLHRILRLHRTRR